MKLFMLAPAALLALSSPIARAENLQTVKLLTVATATLVGTTPSLVIAEDHTRTYLRIENLSGNSIFLKPDSSPGASDSMILAAGEVYEPVWAPANAFYAKNMSVGTNDLVIFAGRGPRRTK